MGHKRSGWDIREGGGRRRARGWDRRGRGWDIRGRVSDMGGRGWHRKGRLWLRRGIGGPLNERGWDRRGRAWERRRMGWDRRKSSNLDSSIVDSQLGGELWYPEQQTTVMFVSVIILYLETVTGGGDFCLLESWAPPVRALLMAFSSSTLKAPTGILDGVTGRRSASNSERRT